MKKILYEYSLVDREDVTDEVVSDLEDFDAEIIRLSVQRLLLMTKINPNEILDIPDTMLHHRISRKVVPESPVNGGVGIRTDTADEAEGFVKLTFSSPIDIYVKSYNWEDGIDTSDLAIVAVGDPEFSMDSAMTENPVLEYELYKELLEQANDLNFVAFRPDVITLEDLPGDKNSGLYAFVMGYIIDHNEQEGAEFWEEAIQDFHELFPDYSLGRGGIYRGIDLFSPKAVNDFEDMIGVSFSDIEKRREYTYIHPFDFPISTSRSRRMAASFANGETPGVVLEFLDVSEEDVVADTREIEGNYPMENEVVLAPDVSYPVQVVHVNEGGR